MTKASEARKLTHPSIAAFTRFPLQEHQAGFWAEPLNKPFFDAWAKWFSRIFRTDVSDEQGEAIYHSLLNQKFTNLDFNSTCDEIEKKNRSWPYIKDFIDAKASLSGGK